MHCDRHAFGTALERAVDGLGIPARQLSGIIAVAPAVLPDLRIAQVGESDIVELQICAAGLRERGNRVAVGRGGVVPDRGHVRVGVAGNSGAAGAQVQHRRRRNGELRRAPGRLLEKQEIADHDFLRVAQLPGDDGNRRLLFGTAELGPGVLAQRHALELREKVEVPPVAAELAVGDRLQADRFLLRHHGAYRALLGFDVLFLARLREPARAQEASDLVGAERRLHALPILPPTPLSAPPALLAIRGDPMAKIRSGSGSIVSPRRG
jgi:hypothetical protein